MTVHLIILASDRASASHAQHSSPPLSCQLSALPLKFPHEICGEEGMDAQTEAALDPILFEHRDMIYAKHLELPLSL